MTMDWMMNEAEPVRLYDILLHGDQRSSPNGDGRSTSSASILKTPTSTADGGKSAATGGAFKHVSFEEQQPEPSAIRYTVRAVDTPPARPRLEHSMQQPRTTAAGKGDDDEINFEHEEFCRYVSQPITKYPFGRGATVVNKLPPTSLPSQVSIVRRCWAFAKRFVSENKWALLLYAAVAAFAAVALGLEVRVPRAFSNAADWCSAVYADASECFHCFLCCR